MRPLATTFLLLLALGATACGADDEGRQLPPQSVADLQGQLDSIQSRFDQPGGVACDDITSGDDPNTTVVARLIDSLPNDVDADLRDALRDSFDRLFDLVQEECADKTETTTTETETTPTETETETDTTPTETDTTPTDTTPTDTTPTDTLPTDTIPTETLPDVPPDAGGGGVGPGEDG